ncbi:conserved membrane hypothetical protein [Mesorhizobium ventifaucium]|uniref:DUF2721 domain-containing protein n=2 Tax=Mesorhizobium ventifaucium TaxID=666020 RepID=A0ABM9E114_9HYPH|nr:conserved membrane hypothetical protein [Mesorhizobium ventifaucium]
MIDNPFFPLSFIAGPAILTNACAILQNGATMRYNLAITQWREFRALLAARDDQLSSQYADPATAVALAERRIRLQLRGLGLLNAAIALFAATTVLGLAGSFFVQLRHLPAAPVSAVMVVTGGAGFLFLLAATVTLFLEGACGRAMLRLHLQLGGSVGAEMQQRRYGSDDL